MMIVIAAFLFAVFVTKGSAHSIRGYHGSVDRHPFEDRDLFQVEDIDLNESYLGVKLKYWILAATVIVFTCCCCTWFQCRRCCRRNKKNNITDADRADLPNAKINKKDNMKISKKDKATSEITTASMSSTAEQIGEPQVTDQDKPKWWANISGESRITQSH